MRECKVIQFKSKNTLTEEERCQRIKDNAKQLIDLCEGDFAIIFKTKDIEQYLEGTIGKELIIGMSDVKRKNPCKDDYFFKSFMDSQYFDLDS